MLRNVYATLRYTVSEATNEQTRAHRFNLFRTKSNSWQSDFIIPVLWRFTHKHRSMYTVQTHYCNYSRLWYIFLSMVGPTVVCLENTVKHTITLGCAVHLNRNFIYKLACTSTTIETFPFIWHRLKIPLHFVSFNHLAIDFSLLL